MRIWSFAASALFVVAMIASASAKDVNSTQEGATPSTYNISVSAVFGRYGFSSSAHVASSSCHVEMELNQRTLIENFTELQSMGLMNQDISETTLNTQPNMISMAFVFQMLPVATKEVYDNNKGADHCVFTQSLSVVDDYGNDKKILMLSYNFTRALYNKINWDQFPAQNMLKVAPKFHFNPRFAAKVVRERENAN